MFVFWVQLLFLNIVFLNKVLNKTTISLIVNTKQPFCRLLKNKLVFGCSIKQKLQKFYKFPQVLILKKYLKTIHRYNNFKILYLETTCIKQKAYFENQNLFLVLFTDSFKANIATYIKSLTSNKNQNETSLKKKLR